MADANLDVQFNFNTAEAKKQTEQIADGAGKVNDKAKETNETNKQTEGILERIQRRMRELRAEAEKAQSVMSVAKINSELQAYEGELVRVARAGRMGFDEAGNAIERTEGILQKLQRSAALYQKGMQEATRPENIEKYRQKLETVNAEMAKLTKGTTAGGGGQWNGLQNSINQLSRELPAFANSAQTGFMAISNNIPSLIDELARLKAANEALSASGEKGKPVWKQLVGSLFSWGTALSVGVTLLTVYGKEIGEFIAALFKGKTAIDQAKESVKTLNKAFDSTDLSKAVSNVKELTIEIDLAKKGLIDKGKVLNHYNDTIGKTTGKVNNLQEAEKALVENADAYVKITLYKAAANLALEDAAKKSLEAERSRLKNIEEFSKTIDKSTGGSTSGYVSDFELAERNQRAKSAAEKRKKDEINAAEEASKAQQNIASDFLKKAAETSKKFKFDFFGGTNEDKGKDKYSGLRRELENAYSKILESRKAVQDKAAALDAEYSRKNLDNDTAEIQAVRDKYTEIRKTIEEENAKIRKYNADPKNKIKVAEIDTTGLADSENKAVATVQEKQNIEQTKIELEQQKQLFAAYEAFKTKLGAQEADGRFKNELKGFKNYSELLKSEQQKIEAIAESERSGNQKEYYKFLINEQKKYNSEAEKEEQKRYEDAYTAVQTSGEKTATIHRKYADLRKQYENITDKQIKADKIAQSIANEAAELESAQAEIFQKTELFRQFNSDLLKLTKQGLLARITAIKQALNAENILPPDLREKLEAELGNAQKLVGGSDITTEINQLKEKLRINKAVLKDSTADAKTKADAVKNIAEANAGLKSMPTKAAGIVANYASEIGSSLQGLGAAVGQFDEGLGDTISTAGELLGVVGDIAGAIASGNPAQMIGALIKGITTIFSLEAAARESARKAQEEIRKHQETVIQGELEYNRLIRERQRSQKAINDMTLQELETQKKLLETQLQTTELRKLTRTNANASPIQRLLGLDKTTYTKQQTDFDYLLERLQNEGAQVTGQHTEKYGGFLGIGRKTRVVTETAGLAGKTYEELEKLYTEGKLTDAAKEMFENLKKAKTEVEELKDQAKQVDEAIKDKMTGGLQASDISNTIIQGFKEGKKAVADFADDMNEVVKNALLSALSAQILEQPLADLVKKFRDDAKDGLSADEIAKFKEQYGKIVQDGLDAVKNVEQITGTIGAGDNGGGIAGRINKNVSEDTASAILGFERSRYDLAKQNQATMDKAITVETKHYEAILESVQTQKQIEANTAETVKVLKEDLKPLLNDIKTNTNTRVTR